jgi:hypothetical protein
LHHKQEHITKPDVPKKLRHQNKDTLHHGSSRFCSVCGDEPYYKLYKTIQNTIAQVEDDNLIATSNEREVNNAVLKVLRKVMFQGGR